MRRVRATLILLAAAMCGLALGGSTASAAPRQPVVYDALGDSYAAGYGVPPYDGPCGRSQSAPAVQIDGREKIQLDDFVACAGATTATLVSRGQLNALDENTDLVTLSIGGNDIGFSAPIVACLGGTEVQCAGALAATTAKVTGVLPGRLDSLYSQVSARAPHAHVVITGYPRLFSPEFGPYLAASVAVEQALNAGADLLNGTIAAVAAEHGFQFLDVTKRFSGHGMNAPDPWILGPSDPGALHPNRDGYTAYAAALTAQCSPARRP
jgi:lysophospholipase L1-like esterase